MPGEVPEILQGIVVRDVNPGRHAVRLLWVPREHVRYGEETKAMRRTARLLLTAIGQAAAVNKNLVLTGFDFCRLSYEDHWHVQVHLDLPIGLLYG